MKYKVVFREITDDGFGMRKVKDSDPIYTVASSKQQAKTFARARIKKRERSEYLPGDGAYITMYVVEPVTA